ncbi:MAG: peptide deformylase [Thermomicrobiales bacterium]
MNIDQQSPWPLINPEIIARSDDTAVVWDACLVFLMIFCQVTRHRTVTVRYQDTDATWHEAHRRRRPRRAHQHEIDPLRRHRLDRITDIQTLVTREEFERRYRDQTVYNQA